MADLKISQLPASTTPLAGTEVLPIVQSGATKQVSVADLTAGRAISATQLTLTVGNLIVASGQGIDFSATSGTGTSELLADYEEGTWTPVFTSLTVVNGTGGATYSGRYTKIGRVVYFEVVIAVTGTCTTASGSSATRFTTPFTIAQDSTAGFTFLRADTIGVGTCDSVTNFVWCPTWVAANNGVIISGFYEV